MSISQHSRESNVIELRLGCSVYTRIQALCLLLNVLSPRAKLRYVSERVHARTAFAVRSPTCWCDTGSSPGMTILLPPFP